MNVSCTICQEFLFTGEDNEPAISSTSCGHVYHSNCLFQWMERSETCPHCRTDLDQDDDVFKLNLIIEKPSTETFDELKNRVKRLSKKIDSDLKRAVEKNKKLEDQVQSLLRGESTLKDELAAKSKKLQKMKENLKTVDSMNEKLKKENEKLKNSIEKNLDIEDNLNDMLDEEAELLEKTRENLFNAYLARKKLKNKKIELECTIEQHLKVKSDLIEKLDTANSVSNIIADKAEWLFEILKAERQKYEVDTSKSKDEIEKLRAKFLRERRKNHSLKQSRELSKKTIVRKNKKLKIKLPTCKEKTM
ncbi:E3 ubiquitin-protein ligase TRAIP-like isoform X2 [Planococcus citri]